MPGQLTRTGLATLVAGGILGAGLAGAGVLVSGAFADTGSPTTTAAPAPGKGTAPKAGSGRHGLGGMFGLQGTPLHGEFVVAKEGGGTETVLVQSGKVTARDGNTVTIKSTDGFTLRWTVNKDSWVLLGAKQGSLDGVATGDELVAAGTKSGDGATVRTISRSMSDAAKRVAGRFGDPGRMPGMPGMRDHGRGGPDAPESPSPTSEGSSFNS